MSRKRPTVTNLTTLSPSLHPAMGDSDWTAIIAAGLALRAGTIDSSAGSTFSFGGVNAAAANLSSAAASLSDPAHPGALAAAIRGAGAAAARHWIDSGGLRESAERIIIGTVGESLTPEVLAAGETIRSMMAEVMLADLEKRNGIAPVPATR